MCMSPPSTASRDPDHSLFPEFFRSHVGTFPGSMRAKFEVRIFSHFGTITINLGDHVTLATPLLEFFSGAMSGLSMRARTPNLNSVALALIELFMFLKSYRFKYTCDDDNDIRRRKQQKLAYHV